MLSPFWKHQTKINIIFKCNDRNRIRCDWRISSFLHARFSIIIYCDFCLQTFSSIGRYKMKSSLKWGKLPEWQEIVTFICGWQGRWYCGPQDWGLRARSIAIVWSIVTCLQCLGWEPICVALDWLVAWVEVMGIKNVVIVLCWWACVVVFLSFNNFSLRLLSSREKSPRLHWFSYSVTLGTGRKFWLKRQWCLPLIS